MADLMSRLLKEYEGFDFFRIVSLLEINFRSNISDSISSSTLRFLSDNNLSFPPNDIAAVTVQKGVMTVALSFMGLSGVTSPLPSYFSDLLTNEHDNCLNDFLNIFNHRIYYLFYKAWKKYQLSSFLSFSGIEYFLSCTQHTENTSDNKGDRFSLIPYCGILLTKCRSKHALEIMLTHYFEEKSIHIEEFVRRKKRLKENLPLGEYMQLGKNTILGENYMDSCGMFRIVIGPLKLVEYVNFTADSINIKLLRKIVNSFISDQLEYDIVVQLRMDGLIPAALGNCSTRLGETTLLGESAGQEMIYSMIVK